jgi:NAD(P)H dehydrogenase (quinone)
MSVISIVYFSATGTTKSLAEAIAAGAGSGAVLVPIEGKQIVEGRFHDDALLAKLSASDAIIFGSPTFMGGVAGQFKAFADATSGIWYQRAWAGKLAGGFTTSGSPSGDKQGTLQYLMTFGMQHGMLWTSQNDISGLFAGVPQDQAVNRLGSYSGVMGQAASGTPLTAGDLETGRLYGARIAGFLAKG